MALSINNYIKNLSYEYYLKNKNTETQKISTSLNGQNGITQRLYHYFGDDILDISLFGSYSRDTILPRKFDIFSDIDLMILFNHEQLQYTPETYRNKLKRFAEQRYSTSVVYKSFPTIVLELNHIKFDLIPAIEEGFIFKSLKIPDKNNRWTVTDPNAFDAKLTKVNSRYGYIVKPIIRLLKAWNASAGYPYQSYILEQKLAGLNFYECDYQSGFFYAVDALSTYDGDTIAIRRKIERLKINAQQAELNLKLEKLDMAKKYLHKILP